MVPLFETRPRKRRYRLKLGRALAIFGLAVPVWAQITPLAGPAVLTRGQAPGELATAQVDPRPFVEVSSVYNNGLAGVLAEDTGQLGTAAATGVEIAGGITGTHSWRHTVLEVDYRGAFRHYDHRTLYDGTDQSLRLNLTHQLARHITLSLRESGGVFSRDFGLLGLPEVVPFDPSSSYVPATNFLDNRTLYLSTQADLTIQKSARVSFDFGGDGFLARRWSTALYGVTGASGRGDVQYRVSRRMTIGAAYRFTSFDYTRVFNATDLHSAVGSFAIRINRSMEFSAYAGVMRSETKFIESVPLNPLVASLLGQSTGAVIAHNIDYAPNFDARVSRVVNKGMLFAGASRSISAGNGLFLTSKATGVFGGYTYTGLRRWSFSTDFSSNMNQSLGNIIGDYRDFGAALRTSHQIGHALYTFAAFSTRWYGSASFAGYNRSIYDARVGVGYAPGDVPLRPW
jgi:hypothetical protein